MRKISNSIYQKSLKPQNTLSRSFSIINNTQNYIINTYIPQNNMIEFEDIKTLINKDSNSNIGPPYNSVKILSIYIRRNRNVIEETIKKISEFLEQNNNLNVNLLLNIVNSILVLLIEKSQIISFLNAILPILVKRLLNTNIKNLTLIENMNNTIGNLIKKGGIYIRRYLLGDINKVFNNLNLEKNNSKNENYIFASILYICKIIENSSLFAYNKITEPKIFAIFQKTLEYFKDSRYEVRYAIGELIKQFNHMLMNRDYKTKYSYEQMIYHGIMETYKNHVKDNYGIPTNLNLVLGMFEILKKMYISEPFFLKKDNNYNELVEQLMKCKSSKINQIRTEFIKFVPELYQINKEIFTKKYLEGFLEENKKYLTLKANNEIRNALLVTLGTLSLHIKKEYFDICLEPLVNLLNDLIIQKNIFDVEIFKCLANLLNNTGNLYIELIVTRFDIYSILAKLFKHGLATYKIEFLTSIMTAFSNFSKEHISTVIASLNVVSLILWDEDFKFEYFFKDINNIKDNFISAKLEGILNNIRKYIRKYMNNLSNNNEYIDIDNLENMTNNNYFTSGYNNYNNLKCLNDWKVIFYALTLFSQIENNLFLKDMLIFYNDKILPLLLFSSNKIKKKILELILCKFVKIYSEDVNYSKYILNNIIDSIRNLIFSVKDLSIRIFALNILHKKTILLDIILEKKENFFCKLIGILETDEEQIIKEKIIQTIGILSSRSNDKNYFITFTKKSIKNILFTIDNCDDIIYKEDLTCLLLYYTLYLKQFYDLNLMEQIIEVLINLNINYDYQGIIFINTLKIVYELLNTDIINNFFLTNSNSHEKINIFCHILLIICVNNLKEGGDDTTKTETILKVLYQIVKIQKINIYKEINTNNMTKTFDSIDLNICKSLTFNNNNKKNKNQKNEQNKSNKENKKDKEKNSINEKLNNELLSNIKKDEKISLVDILLQCIIKGLNDESLKTIMNIFGLSGAMDPSDIERIFLHQDMGIYNLDGNLKEQDYFDDNEFKITKYNPKTKINEEINLSDIEPSTYKPILYIIQFLKENSQQDLIGLIINKFDDLIKNLESKDEQLIELLLPTIIQIIPQVEINYQETLLKCIEIIAKKFKKVIKANINDLVELSQNYILIDQLSKKCCTIFTFLFENYVFEMEIYYPVLIPIFLSLINCRTKKDKKEKTEINNIISIFTIMTKNPNINSYLGIILNELTSLFLITNDYNNCLIEFYDKVVSLQNTYYFYPLIINTLIEKLKLFIRDKLISNEKTKNRFLENIFTQGDSNKKLLLTIIEIFKKMNQINREHFIHFLPMIVENLKGFGLIKHINYEKNIQPMLMEYSDYNYEKVEDFENMIDSQTCLLNCILGFNHNSKEDKNNEKQNNSKKSNKLKNNNNSNTDIATGTMKDGEKNPSQKNIFINQFNKNRKISINNELIIKTFNTNNCVIEEDWQEWFKSTVKVLFENSPSFTLYYCRFIADYYFPLISELYNYAFFLAYKNNNDKNKIQLTDDLKNALQNSKTPNEILLTILNLAEFIDRRNDNNIFFFDFNLFGDISNKCRAFAKALYYKENNFYLKNDYDDIEGLLELYYELKLPESAIGLLKLTEKKKDKIRKSNNLQNSFRKRSYESNNFSELRNSFNFDQKDKDKEEYMYYIKMHNYDEALKRIINKLKNEKNKKNINVLKKYKEICLNGLYDWEQLLSDNDINNRINLNDYYSQNNNSSNLNLDNLEDYEININTTKTYNVNKTEKEMIIIDNDNISKNNKNLLEENKLKSNLEKEILLSKACMNLGEWNELKKHFSKIKTLIKNNNNDIEDDLLYNKENENNDVNDINDMNDDYLTNNVEENKNIFFINHGLSYGVNMNSLDKDFINLNIYISNYNKKKIKLENNNFTHNNNQINRMSIISKNQVDNNTESDKFSSYIDLINNNQNLSFLENNEEILFDLNLYSTILNIESNRYDLAMQYISEAQKLILPRIKSLLSESYIRGYELLIKNQMLYNLEQIIDYKQNHLGEKPYFNNMVKIWDKNLDIIGEDVYLYEKFLAIRSLVLPIDKEYSKYMNLVKICRKLNMYSKSEKILLRLKNKLNIDDEIGEMEDIKKNEIQIQIELSYNKCLFEKGETNDAIDKSKYLVDLLEMAESNNNNNQNNNLYKINNKIKGQIYGSYAKYKSENFIFSDKLIVYDEEKINKKKQIFYIKAMQFLKNPLIIIVQAILIIIQIKGIQEK